MKLLVTGGLGFIGSNFIKKLLTEHSEYEITNVDAEFLGSNKKNLDEFEHNKKYKYFYRRKYNCSFGWPQRGRQKHYYKFITKII